MVLWLLQRWARASFFAWGTPREGTRSHARKPHVCKSGKDGRAIDLVQTRNRQTKRRVLYSVSLLNNCEFGFTHLRSVLSFTNLATVVILKILKLNRKHTFVLGND